MKKSYVHETSLVVTAKIDLGEINEIITLLEPLATEEHSWQSTEIVKKLKALRKDSVEEASREFARMAEKQ